MPTFQDLQKKLQTLRHQIAVKQQLMEYLESKFLSVAGAPAEMMILTEDKLPVPVEAIEKIVDQMSVELSDALAEINLILATPVSR